MSETSTLPEFVRDADRLRRRGRLDDAELVAVSGLMEHPYLAAGHHALARVVYARGDMQRARDEWEMALALEPDHLGALKGLGSLALARRDYPSAERYLDAALSVAPLDADVSAALRLAREHNRDDSPTHRTRPLGVALVDRSTEPFQRAHSAADGEHRTLRAPHLPAFDDPRLIVAVAADHDGFIVDAYSRAEAPADVAATLAGLTRDMGIEAALTTKSLGLGSWQTLTAECSDGSIAMAVDDASRHVVAMCSAADMPFGLARRYLTQLRGHVETWPA